MKAILFIFWFLICTYPVFSHSAKEDFDYSIVFGGCFEKDVVSLKINNTAIFNNYKVENKNALKKGNLSLTQADKKIHLFYNGQEKFKGKVNFHFYLNIDLRVNNKTNKFKIDLRKGKVILVEFCPEKTSTNNKELTIEQVQEQVIFM